MYWEGDHAKRVSRRQLDRALEPYGNRPPKEPPGLCGLIVWLVAGGLALAAGVGVAIGRGWPA